jgi:hypothetical protein
MEEQARVGRRLQRVAAFRPKREVALVKPPASLINHLTANSNSTIGHGSNARGCENRNIRRCQSAENHLRCSSK